jgi:hypothetical protein
MLVACRKSVTKKAPQRNANIPANTSVTSNLSKHRNSKQTKLAPRGSPLESHKGSASHSPVHIQKDQGNPPKSDQPLSSNHPSSSRNTQSNNHHSVFIDPANSEIPNETLPSSNENTTPNTTFTPAHDNVSCHHTVPPSDHTSKHPLKVNSRLSTDKVPDSSLLPNPNNSNPLTLMDIDAIKLNSSTKPHSHPHIQTASCPRTLPAHGSTNSILSSEPTSSTEQPPHLQQEPKCSSPAQTPPLSTITPIITHTSTLPTTPTSNSVSGELGSPHEGSTASHWRSPSAMASGMPNPVLDMSRSRNGTSIKNPNPSNPC